MILSSSFEKCENHSRNETHLLLSDNLVSIAREEERELKRNPSVPAKESEVPLPLKETETSSQLKRGSDSYLLNRMCVCIYNDSFFFSPLRWIIPPMELLLLADVIHKERNFSTNILKVSPSEAVFPFHCP